VRQLSPGSFVQEEIDARYDLYHHTADNANERGVWGLLGEQKSGSPQKKSDTNGSGNKCSPKAQFRMRTRIFIISPEEFC